MVNLEFNTIPFTNIDNEVFIGRYDGEDYVIEPGEKRFFPSFLSEHFLKHLGDKMINRAFRGNPKINRTEFFNGLKEKILGKEMMTKGGDAEKTMKDRVFEHEGKVKEMIMREGIKEKWRNENIT